MNDGWLWLGHVDVHAREFGHLLVLDQHRLGRWAAACVQVLFGLTFSVLILVARLAMVWGKHLELLRRLSKRRLPSWARDRLLKLSQLLSPESFRGFGAHHGLSAILRCLCYAVSDRTLQEISHFSPVVCSDESDERWSTPRFILHRLTNSRLCNSLRSIWHYRWRHRPLNLIHFLLHIPRGFCSTQRRLHTRFRKYVAHSRWFGKPKLHNTCRWPLAYGVCLCLALRGNVLECIDTTTQKRLHFLVELLPFRIEVLARFELQLRAFPWLSSRQLELLLLDGSQLRVYSVLRRLLALHHQLALYWSSSRTCVCLIFIISVEIRQVIKGPIFLHVKTN